MPNSKLIAIYGPTTTNKLGLAYKISKYLHGKHHLGSEVINTDSRKIYEGLAVSQSLPTEDFHKRVGGVHLFGEISPHKMLSIDEFAGLVKYKVNEVTDRGNVAILVGGSPLHLRSVLQNWVGKSSTLIKNTLVLGLRIKKEMIKHAVSKNVGKMFRDSLYVEFKILYSKSLDGKFDTELLKNTLGYRQFLEMAEVSETSPLKLNRLQLIKVQKWIVKDILNYAYKQSLEMKKMPNLHVVKNFKQTTKLVDKFL